MMENMENKVRVDLTDAPWVECSEGNKVFDKRMLFKRLSPLVSPTGNEEMIPLEVIICSKCGKVPKFFYERAKDVPEELRSTCTFNY